MRRAITEAVAMQRDATVEEERAARQAIEEQGCAITELTLGEHAAFAAAVMPLLDEARATYGNDLRLATGR
jgi:TRAP-type C4-dicarboxylate transport system substrate-binding protein